jgi:hypothetical protein
MTVYGAWPSLLFIAESVYLLVIFLSPLAIHTYNEIHSVSEQFLFPRHPHTFSSHLSLAQ